MRIVAHKVGPGIRPSFTRPSLSRNVTYQSVVSNIMPMKFTVLIIFLFSWTLPDKGIPITGTKFKGVMFPPNFDIKQGFSDSTYADHFTLTEEMIFDLEKQLKSEIKNLTSNAPNQGKGLGPIIHKNLDKYYRQYIGLIDEKGTKYILINFVWSTIGVLETKDPLTYWIQVHDGGSNFWNIKYNLSTKTFYDGQVNGVA